MAGETPDGESGARTEWPKAMTLETGTNLGPYEIVAPLGAGGMDEVYRPRDTKPAPLSLVMRAAYGRICYYARQYDLAIERCHKALRFRLMSSSA